MLEGSEKEEEEQEEQETMEDKGEQPNSSSEFWDLGEKEGVFIFCVL